MHLASLGLVLALSACVTSNSIVCDDGRLCPEATVCDDIHAGCVAPDQLTMCEGKADREPCSLPGGPGSCHEMVCLSAACGNDRVDTGEVCDDGNLADTDGCAADCLSDETCGNGLIDQSVGETCDDIGLLFDHDGCSSTCQTEQAHWLEHTLTPGRRAYGRMVYDARRGRSVMFGGQTATSTPENWEWTGADWVHLPSDAIPFPRFAPMMAYDHERGKTVVYGGGGLEDTWEWDGTTWTPRDVPGPSPGRQAAAMTYDARRHRVVLFGGGAAATLLDDTWEWDGATWTKMNPAHKPPARVSAMIAFDPVRGVVVLTGGRDSAPRADTWTYDGDWHDVTPLGLSPQVDSGAMAWDVSTQRVILFGGTNASFTNQATTWAWNGSMWATLPITSPSARSSFQLAATRGGLVLFGGSPTPFSSASAYLDETWLFANNTWKQPVTPGVLSDYGAANDPERDRILIYGGLDDSFTRTDKTWALTPRGFELLTSGTPSARRNAALTYDPVHRNFVLFGGYIGTGGSADTWIFDGTAWTPRTPAGPPPARLAAAVAFDGNQVTMFGGRNVTDATDLADTWRWDGMVWTPVTPAHSPPARAYAAYGYDPVRRRMVMFGGIADASNAATQLGDTWTFDGVDWTQITIGGTPPPRGNVTMAWNAARQRLVLAGGGNGIVDSWEFDGTQWHAVGTPELPPARGSFAAASSLDGAGIVVYSGTALATDDKLLELRWDGPRAAERCDAHDLDGDMLVGCADPDCWPVCAPLCPPATTCDPSAPTCGDGVCDAARESCRTCAADCTTCAAVCGDFECDPGETCPGDCP